jgi:hypothetical protein
MKSSAKELATTKNYCTTKLSLVWPNSRNYYKIEGTSLSTTKVILGSWIQLEYNRIMRRYIVHLATITYLNKKLLKTDKNPQKFSPGM